MIQMENTIQVLSIDHDMPKINGIDVLKKICAIAPSIGVIIFTGRSQGEIVIEALNNGADYYLIKGENVHVFTELAHYTVQNYSTTADSDVAINAGAYRLSLNSAILAGLIVNELMMNSFKYAFSGRSHGLISISLTEEESSNPTLRSFKLRYKDDGCGFPADLSFKTLKTLEMHLIRMLSKQLVNSAKIIPNIPPGKRGTVFELIFSDYCVKLYDSLDSNV
jgi:two-component sensor histidine kinase